MLLLKMFWRLQRAEVLKSRKLALQYILVLSTFGFESNVALIQLILLVKKKIYIYELLLCFPPLFLCHFCISCHTDFKIRLKKKSLRSDHCWTRLLYLLLFLLIEPQVIWDSGCKQLNWWLGRKANRWIQQGVFFNMEFHDYQANSAWYPCQQLIQLGPWSTSLSHQQCVTRGRGVEVGVWCDLQEFGIGRTERELYRDRSFIFVKGKGLQLSQTFQFERM